MYVEASVLCDVYVCACVCVCARVRVCMCTVCARATA